ncbi:MAG: hypothetical protein JRG96_06320 [Deltaproteobacteria bacterium]|nr:hypothetical protein [Deltaproteobacteria bacterium]
MRDAAAGPDPRRRALDEALLEWMAEEQWKRDDDRFDRLARELFAFQFEHCAAYARFCRGRGVTPERVGHWTQIPAVPAGAFKELRLHSFPEALTCKTFRTSGTSGSGRGALHLDTLALYEASLLPTIARYLFPDLRLGQTRMAIRILAPAPGEAPDSSLSHMFGCTLAALGSGGSGYDTHGSALHADELMAALGHATAAGEAIALCGTAFAFVHLLDAMEEQSGLPAAIALAPGSRIMETGGFKGRSRELPREELYARLETQLGVPEDHIVNQYGMTELASQFYDSPVFDAARGQQEDETRPSAFQRRGEDTQAALPRCGEDTLTGAFRRRGEETLSGAFRRRKLGPPWARVRIVDPHSGEEAVDGEVGMIVIHDLANSGSVAAIESADLGRKVVAPGEPDPLYREGFEVLGRAAGAEQRGCSIAADAMLEENP